MVFREVSVIEIREALRAWLQAEQEAAIAAYYTERSEDEAAEDRAWSAIAAQSAAKLWP